MHPKLFGRCGRHDPGPLINELGELIVLLAPSGAGPVAAGGRVNAGWAHALDVPRLLAGVVAGVYALLPQAMSDVESESAKELPLSALG